MGLAAATRTCVLCLTRILRGVAIQVEDDQGRRLPATSTMGVSTELVLHPLEKMCVKEGNSITL